ncbi:MAG TPA: RHS repeat-associated core domain-containing protein, partial [Fermentimonas sp.]|nr:RHS repeat-associated core domain-containing protein [Fermentimonas sp.]
MQLDTILDYTYDVNYSVQKGECLKLGMWLPLSYCMEYEDHISASNTIPFEMESVDIDGEGRIYHTSTSGFKYDCYIKDHLGSTRMVVNDENVVTEAFAYQPYGTIIPLEDIAATPQTPARQQFTGKEFDTEGGIDAYYFGARMYDPEIGRWVSVDKEMQFIDAYLYCHTNPIMYVDTNGNFDTFIHFLVGNF